MWYENPYFLASFGAAAALGLVVLTLAFLAWQKRWTDRFEDGLRNRWTGPPMPRTRRPASPPPGQQVMSEVERYEANKPRLIAEIQALKAEKEKKEHPREVRLIRFPRKERAS